MNTFEKIVVALLGAIAISGAVTAYEIRQIARNGFEVELDDEQVQAIEAEVSEAAEAAFEDIEESEQVKRGASAMGPRIKKGTKMKTYTILLGLNDKDSKTQKYDTIEAYKVTNNLVLSRIGFGTISQAYGVYTHEDGTPVIETSLRIEVAGDGIRPKVTSLIESLKEVFNQESVMLSETETAVSYL